MNGTREAAKTVRYTGGCHCGAVRFAVRVAPDAHVARACNCSICFKVGFLHVIVERDAFEVLSGHESITTYTFNTGVAQHTFCKTCGVKPFYTPRSHPTGVSTNLRCFDGVEAGLLDAFAVEDFDGRNWEQAVGSIR